MTFRLYAFAQEHIAHAICTVRGSNSLSQSVGLSMLTHSLNAVLHAQHALLPVARVCNLVDVQGCVGLENLGNTCFANSIMQCLMAIPELASYCLNPPEAGQLWGPVSGGFATLVQHVFRSPGIPINPYR